MASTNLHSFLTLEDFTSKDRSMVAGGTLSPGEEVMLPRQLLMVTGHSGHLASPVSQLNLNQFAATSQPSPAQPSTAQATGFHQPARHC